MINIINYSNICTKFLNFNRFLKYEKWSVLLYSIFSIFFFINALNKTFEKHKTTSL